MSAIQSMKSVRSCNVATGKTPRQHGDRYVGNSVLCQTHTGLDVAGRSVSHYSTNKMAPGCNSPHERTTVENHLRPNYVGITTLEDTGINVNFDNGPIHSFSHGSFNQDSYALINCGTSSLPSTYRGAMPKGTTGGYKKL
jgi:hypothetical protein